MSADVVHVIYRFAAGGLENGLVNLLNHLPSGGPTHAVVALTEIERFAQRIEREDVPLIALNKPPGQGVRVYPKLARVLRTLRPAIVHTRGLAALEMAPLARAFGARVIHGEHGWDATDPTGMALRSRLIRRVMRPFVTHHIALTRHIADYLEQVIGVAQENMSLIANGVDCERFHPAAGAREPIAGSPFNQPDLIVVGHVARMAAVKNPLMLIEAFSVASEAVPQLRLVMVGDGPLARAAAQAAQEQGIAQKVWFTGEREDIPALMRGFDLFALPSRAEGMSNTLLEAMASGLPVVATAVGGNLELVEAGVTGVLVEAGDRAGFGHALSMLATRPRRAAMRLAARTRAQREFSLGAMVEAYQGVYSRMLRTH